MLALLLLWPRYFFPFLWLSVYFILDPVNVWLRKPSLLQYIAKASPLKHFLIIVQGSFLKSMPAVDVWSNVWPMLIIAAVTLTTATVFVQRRLQ